MSDERHDLISAQNQFKLRAEEYGYYSRYFSEGSVKEQVIGRKYSLLRAECAHVANYYEDQLHVNAVELSETSLTILFEHLAKLHLDLAKRHEEFKMQKGIDELMHQHLELFHRNLGQARAEESKLFKRGQRLESKR